MGGIEMFVRWWYLNGYAITIVRPGLSRSGSARSKAWMSGFGRRDMAFRAGVSVPP
ncbi:MAG: hypothetical protein LBT40_08170 [Deltaproteobacteria bacterium]|nr:hypothetical protein [Deltaproteobacteria bacterium]